MLLCMKDSYLMMIMMMIMIMMMMMMMKDSYNYLMVDLRDPRVDTWPLMGSIWPTTIICLIYVYLVKVSVVNIRLDNIRTSIERAIDIMTRLKVDKIKPWN